MADKNASRSRPDESFLDDAAEETTPAAESHTSAGGTDEPDGEPGMAPGGADGAAEELASEPGDGEPADDLGAARAEIQALQDSLRRSQAELINFRRRTNRERLERMDAARVDMLRGLLPVLDDLDRAVHDDTDNIDAYREGVELILKTLHDTLRQLDVTRIDPAGEPFDPHHHEAVEQEQTDEVPAGHIARVYQPGYLFKERLLRPATVAVAVAVADPDAAAGEDD